MTRALADLPPLPETFFKVVAMTSDPLLDHEHAYRISSAIYIEEGTREPLIPHNACARIIDPRETYGVL
eukprot:8208260-Prorocentrum_lima.AAC.1